MTAPFDLHSVGVLASNLLLADLAVRLHRLLAERGMTCCAIKGAALLPVVYREDPEARPMNDVDWLVAPGCTRQAAAILQTEFGYEPVPDSGLEFQPRPGMPGRGVVRIDLHDRLHFGGEAAARAVLARSRRVAWGGGWIGVPESEDQLVEVVAHALLHQMGFKEHQLEDVRRLAVVSDAGLLRRRAAAAGMLAPLRLALQMAGCEAARSLLVRLPKARGSERVVEHFLRRRVCMDAPPGRTHLWLGLWFRPFPGQVAHLARRVVLGPASAQRVEAGLGAGNLGGQPGAGYNAGGRAAARP